MDLIKASGIANLSVFKMFLCTKTSAYRKIFVLTLRNYGFNKRNHLLLTFFAKYLSSA